jgi:hypothetical protein
MATTWQRTPPMSDPGHTHPRWGGSSRVGILLLGAVALASPVTGPISRERGPRNFPRWGEKAQRPARAAVAARPIQFTSNRREPRSKKGHPRMPRDQRSDPRPAKSGAAVTHVLREEVSAGGQRIRLSLGRGGYRDARPYYTAAVLRRDGAPSSRTTRYTPSLHRAEFLFERFLDDVTGSRALAARAMPPVDPALPGSR